MKKTLKFLAATALVALFLAPMHSTAAHLHGPGYWGPHYGSGLYHPWHGRGFGHGHGRLSGSIGFSTRAAGYGRGWGRGYSRPYLVPPPSPPTALALSPRAMTVPGSSARDNQSY